MINKLILKKKIIYRSLHRGSKEMDMLLGNFVKRYVEEFNDSELKDLEEILFIEDEILYKWYCGKDLNTGVPNTKVSALLKKFKL